MTTEEKLVNRLILHANDGKAPGLLFGQMGAVLVITEYARKKSKPYFEDSADFIYDSVIHQITEETGLDFATGLAGICWGVEYLTQNGILPGTGDEICNDLDKRIMRLNIKRIDDFSLESGLLGQWAYVSARLQGNIKAGLDLPFDADYLDNWAFILERHADKFPKGAYRWLRNARNGQMEYEPLDFSLFVTPLDSIPEKNLSLFNGIAGYIALNYLNSNTHD